MGESQGDFVAALTAAERHNEISGLIMLHPAFATPDNAKSTYASVSDIPDDNNMWGLEHLYLINTGAFY